MKLNIVKNIRKREKKIEKKENTDKNNLLNFENLKNILGNSEDMKYRDLVLNSNPGMSVNLIYLDGVSNQTEISDYVIKPLMQDSKIKEAKTLDEVIKLVEEGVLYYVDQTTTKDLQKAVQLVAAGATLLVFSEQNIAFAFVAYGFERRAIAEPTIENVSKGSKDTFVENYRSNTSTIRRKIKSKDLMIENMSIGKQTNTTVSIVYMKNIANDDLIQKVRDRLSAINTDNVLNTSIIEDALSDDIGCTFPQALSTERPDKFCSDIIEGRAGIIVDGIPFAFIVPGTFVQFIQSSEDYSRKYMVASLLRIIRFISLVISLTLPAFYIAITTFHPEMIPTELALFIAKSREGVTFPVAVETLLMLLAFEILYEAGLRVPKTIGQAVSIVGTLVVGQAAVEAKLVSPAVVVVIAMTSIAAFTMPNQDFSSSVRIWRIIFAAFSTILGLVGFVLTVILFIFKLCKLESFGVPYMAPLVSNDGENIFDDTIFRMPLKYNKMRPISLKPKNIKRQGH